MNKYDKLFKKLCKSANTNQFKDFEEMMNDLKQIENMEIY